MIEEEMYGMIPSAKMENLSKAPPAKRSTIFKNPSPGSEVIPETIRELIPGMVT